MSEVETVRVGETNYGVLGGAGSIRSRTCASTLAAASSSRASSTSRTSAASPVYTYGGSGRVVVHQNMPVPQSVDFLLYRNDPAKPLILFKPEKYDPNQFAWSLSAEARFLQQHLKDFDAAGAHEGSVARSRAPCKASSAPATSASARRVSTAT